MQAFRAFPLHQLPLQTEPFKSYWYWVDRAAKTFILSSHIPQSKLHMSILFGVYREVRRAVLVSGAAVEFMWRTSQRASSEIFGAGALKLCYVTSIVTKSKLMQSNFNLNICRTKLHSNGECGRAIARLEGIMCAYHLE